jgi:hypothetical protein
VVDGTDNFPTRYLVNDACGLLNKASPRCLPVTPAPAAVIGSTPACRILDARCRIPVAGGCVFTGIRPLASGIRLSYFPQPGPRTALPGLAPECWPSFITTTPFTITYLIPTGS